MKATLIIILFAGFHLSSQEQDCVDLSKSFFCFVDIIIQCAKKNDLSPVKLMTSVKSQSVSKPVVCTAACILEKIGFIWNDNINMEILKSLTERIIPRSLNKMVIGTISKCAEKGSENDKCENLMTTIKCIMTQSKWMIG
ncbi:uncharacterized protein [Periplaneta americana]|uniref:uncharacterized protein n=1 Tax=Periplaneta americana TaxID=6978 RepID=UPI0037E868CC